MLLGHVKQSEPPHAKNKKNTDTTVYNLKTEVEVEAKMMRLRSRKSVKHLTRDEWILTFARHGCSVRHQITSTDTFSADFNRSTYFTEFSVAVY